MVFLRIRESVLYVSNLIETEIDVQVIDSGWSDVEAVIRACRKEKAVDVVKVVQNAYLTRVGTVSAGYGVAWRGRDGPERFPGAGAIPRRRASVHASQ